MRLELNYYDDMLGKRLKMAVWCGTATSYNFVVINKVFLVMDVHAYVEWTDQLCLRHLVGFAE